MGKSALKAIAGLKIRDDDGWEEKGFPEMLSTSHFYLAEPGDRLVLLDKRYEFKIATYSAKVDEKWIYTFSYAPNQAWVSYNNDLSGESYHREDYIFRTETYFRICLRKADGTAFSGEDINQIITFEKKDVLRFVLLTDTHYVVNGTWDMTAGAVWAASRRQKFAGIIHLGDITDGMLSKEICIDYAKIILDDLRATGVPVWVAIGNHDTNYFKKNDEILTVAEQCELYLEGDKPRYYVDFGTHKLRLLFLDSYEPGHPLRYGYSPECIAWVDETLRMMPDDWSAVIFSHVTPVTRLQVWVKQIRGEEELLNILRKNAKKILAFINGHAHADILYNEEPFPLITVGCAKCEDETVHKPPGAVTPERKPGGKTQDLWDILIIDTNEKTLRLKRQGAGNDRIVRGGKIEFCHSEP